MADIHYTFSEAPVYHTDIRRFQNTDPVNAETVVNPVIQRLIDNIHAIMDGKLFKKMFDEMRQQWHDNDASEYSEKARKWAVDSGLVVGGSTEEFNGMWEDLMTREQLVTVLYRFAQMMSRA